MQLHVYFWQQALQSDPYLNSTIVLFDTVSECTIMIIQKVEEYYDRNKGCIMWNVLGNWGIKHIQQKQYDVHQNHIWFSSSLVNQYACHMLCASINQSGLLAFFLHLKSHPLCEAWTIGICFPALMLQQGSFNQLTDGHQALVKIAG